jgi:hypothetical protein
LIHPDNAHTASKVRPAGTNASRECHSFVNGR